jgi:tetratricopeptide (TPR) repeat protein
LLYLFVSLHPFALLHPFVKDAIWYLRFGWLRHPLGLSLLTVSLLTQGLDPSASVDTMVDLDSTARADTASQMAGTPSRPGVDSLRSISNIGVLFDAATQAKQAGDSTRALRLYGRILQVDSMQSGAYFQRGRIYAGQGRYREAAAELVAYESVYATPRANYIGTKGWYWLLAGEVEQARTASRRAMDIAPRAVPWPLNLGHTFLVDHQPETAKFFYRQAMENIQDRSDLDLCLRDFDRLAKPAYAARIAADPDPHIARVRAMKDWFHVTYLREGDDLRSQTSWLAFLGTWITLVGGLISLFGESSKSLTAESRAAVRDWLLGNDYAAKVQQWPETFQSLFKSVFTSQHWNWACAGRSALASVGMIGLTFLIMITFGWTTTYQLARFGGTGSVPLGFAMTIGLVGGINILIDYVSLYQTRRVIAWMTTADQAWRRGALLALDAGLTFLLPLVVTSTMQLVATFMSGQLSDTSPSFLLVTGLVEYPKFILGRLDDSPILQAMYISTFVTSIWLWLFVVGGALLRLLNSALSQVQWLSSLVDVEQEPVKALGVMLALLATVVFAAAAPVVL